jgi:hypothetical protein
MSVDDILQGKFMEDDEDEDEDEVSLVVLTVLQLTNSTK